jgi:hypothetical protein
LSQASGRKSFTNLHVDLRGAIRCCGAVLLSTLTLEQETIRIHVREYVTLGEVNGEFHGLFG